jgi:MinD superfamily P-loop ATPase
MTKIVINACYGGFSLSDKAIKCYARIKGITLSSEIDDYGYTHYTTDYDKYFRDSEIARDDQALAQVVEELGVDANGNGAKLMVIDLAPGTLYRIREYDGMEYIEKSTDIVWNIA